MDKEFDFNGSMYSLPGYLTLLTPQQSLQQPLYCHYVGDAVTVDRKTPDQLHGVAS